MRRLRVEGEPEDVFLKVQQKLKELGASAHLVDRRSITLLFDMDIVQAGQTSRFFLAVLPATPGRSDVALARRRNDRRNDFQAMIVSEDDPIEAEVLGALFAEDSDGEA